MSQPLAVNTPVIEAQVVTFSDRAILLTSRNVPVVPVKAGSKVAILTNWPGLATTDQSQIEKWNREYPNANTAAVAKNHIGRLLLL